MGCKLFDQPEHIFCGFDKALRVLARLVPSKPALALLLGKKLFSEFFGDPGENDGVAGLEFDKKMFGCGPEKLNLGHALQPSPNESRIFALDPPLELDPLSDALKDGLKNRVAFAEKLTPVEVVRSLGQIFVTGEVESVAVSVTEGIVLDGLGVGQVE